MVTLKSTRSANEFLVILERDFLLRWCRELPEAKTNEAFLSFFLDVR